MFGRLKSLLLSCPHCGYKQEESQVARSTFCRKRECGAHYRIEDGQPVPETPPAAYPFPLRDQLGDKEGHKTLGDLLGEKLANDLDAAAGPPLVFKPKLSVSGPRLSVSGA